jgi:hypothetical protein
MIHWRTCTRAQIALRQGDFPDSTCWSCAMAQISGGRRDLSSDTGPRRCRRSAVGGRRSGVGGAELDVGDRGEQKSAHPSDSRGSPLGFGGVLRICAAQRAWRTNPGKTGGVAAICPTRLRTALHPGPTAASQTGWCDRLPRAPRGSPSDHTITPRSHPKAVTPAHPQRAPPATRTTAIAGLTRYRRMRASWPSASTNAEQSGRRTAWRSSGGCRPDRSRRRSRSRQPC